jgi:ribosomal protein L37AE/L43A
MKNKIESDYEIKNDLDFLNDNVKKNKKMKKHVCPYCFNEVRWKLVDSYLFCTKCHKRVSGKIMKTDESSVKSNV